MKKLSILITLLMTLTFTAYAENIKAVASPQQVIQQTGDKLFSRIAENQASLKKFPELMRDIVEEELMPAIDHRYAAFKILGKHLRKTNKAQRAKFSGAMRNYLIRTYATALTQYNNQKVIFEPERPLKAKAKLTSVDVRIVDADKPEITITFQMRKDKKSQQWRAYDMIIEGISLISSKQAEFNRKIAKLGIDQVTLELSALEK